MHGIRSSSGRGRARLLSLVFITCMTGLIPLRAHAACDLPILLGNPIQYFAGITPAFIATGDFNEDGKIDLAVSKSDGGGASGLSILLGTGPGTWAPPVGYAVGSLPLGVVVDDFNEDGILDVAVANKESNNVSILLGNGGGGVGNGTFGGVVNYPTGGKPFQIVRDDFNGDGISDLAVSINSAPAVSVLLGLGSGGVGNGTFAAPTSFLIASPATGLEHGDFNADGISDLVVTENGSFTVAVLLGQGAGGVGNGSFASPVHYAAGAGDPFDIAVGDFNEDGISDLAIANTTSGGTAVLLGNGSGGVANGTFGSPSNLVSGNTPGVTTGDLNQDGITDLIVSTTAAGDAGAVKVFIGNGTGGVGNGTFGSATSYPVGGDCYQVLATDLDGDGDTDVLASVYLHDYITLLAGVCNAGLPDPRAPQIVKIKDVPNDQGGHVFATWTASTLDVPGGSVNSYRVWRRIPALAAAGLQGIETITTTNPDGTTDITFWEALATLPAERLPGYGYTAATTQDSLPWGNPYTAFFITALTSAPDVFYRSEIDSGYSVDNLRPAPPPMFAADYGPSDVALHWGKNTEADFLAYRLYRGDAPDFKLGPPTLVVTLSDTGFVDADGKSTDYYKLVAVDLHENESPVALVSPPQVTGVGDGATRLAFALTGTWPNPASRSLWIAYASPGEEDVWIDVMDLGGRRVLTRRVSTRDPGSRRVELDGLERLPTGVYEVRLREGAHVAMTRMVLLR